MLSSAAAAARTSGNAYLRFRIDGRLTAALAMEQIQEVLRVRARRVTAMPNLPESVLGLMHRQNHVCWVVDLAALAEREPLDPHVQDHNVILCRVDGMPLGLAVHEVHSVVHLGSANIQSPPLMPVNAGLAAFVRGYAVVPPGEVLAVLDAHALVHASALRSG
jgi:twitching motility protein PilI